MASGTLGRVLQLPALGPWSLPMRSAAPTPPIECLESDPASRSCRADDVLPATPALPDRLPAAPPAQPAPRRPNCRRGIERSGIRHRHALDCHLSLVICHLQLPANDK